MSLRAVQNRICHAEQARKALGLHVDVRCQHTEGGLTMRGQLRVDEVADAAEISLHVCRRQPELRRIAGRAAIQKYRATENVQPSLDAAG